MDTLLSNEEEVIRNKIINILEDYSCDLEHFEAVIDADYNAVADRLIELFMQVK